MVFRIVNSRYDLDLTKEQALDLYHQLRTALYRRPVARAVAIIAEVERTEPQPQVES